MKPNADIMKKLFTLSIIALFSISLIAQNRAQLPANLRNYSVKAPTHTPKEPVPLNQSQVLELPHNKAPFVFEEEIGSSYYDLMTNRSCYNRNYLYPDGTVAAAWTFAGTSSYTDRGTGYNYYDPTLPLGSQWLPAPTTRIETIRTGFPSYSPIGAGELVVAHSATQLAMSKRDTKGTGVWTQTLIPFNTGTEPTWPRVCVSGNSIHVICVDFTTTKFLYFRSTDGGTTWDKQGEEIPGLEKDIYYPDGFDADSYDWAQPVGNTLAFLVGDKAKDLVLMKSTDNGNTWTKTVIFQHPYPLFVETTTLVTDTPAVCDGAHSITLDASGNAYVAFGTCGFLNDDLTDAGYNFFPAYHNCIGFWKEGDPMLTSVLPEDLDVNCKTIAWSLDLDGDSVLFSTGGTFGDYQLGITSMPQLTFGNDGNLYLIYISPLETMQSGAGQYFNHIWGRRSLTNGDTWTIFKDLTGGDDHVGLECVYPSMSPTTDGKVHFIYMSDFEPGNALNNDGDPVAYNSIMAATYNLADFSDTVLVCTVGMQEVNLNGNVNIYPNPVADYMNVDFTFSKSSDVKMNIYNAVGSLVKAESFVAGRGESKRINTKDLAKGIYLVKFETSSGTITRKIIKN